MRPKHLTALREMLKEDGPRDVLRVVRDFLYLNRLRTSGRPQEVIKSYEDDLGACLVNAFSKGDGLLQVKLHLSEEEVQRFATRPDTDERIT